MKAQDFFPFNSTIVGLNNIYNTVGSNSFYINSSCILATDKIITIGKEYIIFDSSTEDGIRMYDIELMDAFYKEGIINLIVRNIKLNRVIIITHRIVSSKRDCKWVLIDLNYFIDKMDALAIQSYCDGCNDPEKKPDTKISNGSSQNDLLEFEF
jgi:hypothetical protein